MQFDSEEILKVLRISRVYTRKGRFFKSSTEKIIAVNRVSFSLKRGEIFGLVGESGSGKTTIGRMIVALERPDEGTIYLDGRDVTGLKGRELKDYRRRVQMIFQDPYQSLNPQLSIFESISEPLVVHKIDRGIDRVSKVIETMKMVGLTPPEDIMHRFPHQLSGGQRQRVAIARAMVLDPELIVADEPTSMLDASYSAQIFNILLDMRKRFNVTILFITHSLASARYLCNRIGVIYRGNLMELGTSEQIIKTPSHPYTQALMDAIPRFGRCEDLKKYNTLLEPERDFRGDSSCPFYTRCRKAEPEICSKNIPELKNIEDGHMVACFYPESPSELIESEKKCYLGI